MTKLNIKPHFASWMAIIFILFLSACSVTKHLPTGEKLYKGAKIKIVSTENVNNRKMKTVAKTAVRPTPNKSTFGLHPRLWLYLSVGENPKGKFKQWVKKRGEAPVLMTNVNALATAAVIDAKFYNMGVFNSYTAFEIVEKKHKGMVIYTSHIHKPYTIKSLVYTISDDSLSNTILSDKKNSLIKIGDDYNLDKLKAERVRIDALLKNKGYFYFNPDYLLFKADTSTVNHSISFVLSLKDSIPANALRIYRINKVFINQNYSLRDDTRDVSRDTIMFQNTVFIGKDSIMNIHPKVILKSVYLRKHEIYSRENHNITLNRLMSMGNFKFVQVKFSDSDTTATGFLDVNIFLTPMTNHSFRTEIDLVTKSNNYTGPRMNFSLLNRNTFKGAEKLNLSMAGSFEGQLMGSNKNSFSYLWNPQIELTVPRILSIFKKKHSKSIYVPNTTFLLSYNFLKRVNYFDMSTFLFEYGFKWKSTITIEQKLKPISISYTSIGNESAAFNNLLDSIPFLKKSYEEQFIFGKNYSFTYNEQVLQKKKFQYFFNFNIETAGDLFYLVKLINGDKVSSDNPSKMLGTIYSQYASASIDTRAYYNFENKDKIVVRFFTGVAKAYGNSSTLPYSKQFFSGGPNSIRAFQINSLGPGTYQQDPTKTGFLQLGGDIKVETNAEYRFGIYKFVKGALFVDAGNVWLQKSNPSDIGTPFSFSSFVNEIAVGTGLGLRVDVSFFVLRFDLAMPLRKPWLEKNQRWVINDINFKNSSWRSNNLVLNIAIGYPF